MQKAFVVRTALENPVGASWSHEVDAGAESDANPLSRFLAQGWRVVSTCPMPSDLECCCLVVLESPAEADESELDPPLVQSAIIPHKFMAKAC